MSGANVTLVCGGVLLLVVLLHGGRRTGAVLAGVALVGLVVVARPEPSVLRAAVMGAVGLLGVVVGRRGGGASALCLAVVVVLLADPWLSRAAGFRLSVLATGALVLLAVPWSRALGRVLPRPLALAVAVPAAAQAAVTPVLVGLDPVVSPYALPANVLAGPAVPPATLLGVVAALLSLVHDGLAAAVATPARWCASWITAVGRTAADLPGASVAVPEGWVGALLAAAVTAGALATGVVALRLLPDRRGPGQTWAPWPRPPGHARVGAPVGPRGRTPAPGPAPATGRATGVVVVVVLALVPVLLLLHGRGVLPLPGGPGPGGPWPGEDWAVVVCDVGQGESVLVRAGPGAAVVVDTGPEPAPLERCLGRAGVTEVPLLVLTHLHADHVGGLAAVGETTTVGQVWSAPGGMPARVEADLVRWAAEEGAELVHPVAGVSAGVGRVRVEVLAPLVPARAEGDAQDVNDAGLVVRLRGGGLVLLAVGDIGAAVQRRVVTAHPADGLRADVTTVAHHGSADQLPAFYAAVGARVAVASAGADNGYGHPTEKAREVVTGAGALVLSTVEHGDVALRAAGPGADGSVTVGVRTTGRVPRRPAAPSGDRGRAVSGVRASMTPWPDDRAAEDVPRPRPDPARSRWAPPRWCSSWAPRPRWPTSPSGAWSPRCGSRCPTSSGTPSAPSGTPPAT